MKPSLSVRPADGRKALVLCSRICSQQGWGTYGLNLALALSRQTAWVPLIGIPFDPAACVLDPLRQHSVHSLAAASSTLQDAVRNFSDMTIQVDAPVLCTLDADLGPEPALRLQGEPPVAIACLDHATLSPIAQERASRFALIIAASSWTESVLRANGIVATVTVPFGVDTALFHPAPRTGQFRDRFVVFSGGGLDDRAGQDLVVKAFRIFHQRHNNAVLVTTWPSPDAVTWAIGHGIPGDALIALGPVPEIAMPHVLREADVALFPSRAEGGTNPLAMAAMACGVPVILSAHTGHLDLLNAGDVALRLDRQTPLDHPGWAESDIEEILEYLETVWRDPDAAAALGARGAALMAPMTWQRHADALLEAIDPLLP